MKYFVPLLLPLWTSTAYSQTTETLKYGDFENWLTRNIHESKLIGGAEKKVYEIAPNGEVDGNKAYSNQGGSPWATSNVMAKVAGIVKASNAVFPDENPSGGRCCKLTTIYEKVKVLGIVNLEVLVSGSIYLGHNNEPIRSTSNPYGKMEMGVPFTKHPKYLTLDYRVEVPEGAQKVRATGTSKKNLPGHDSAEVYILLQRRWEDKDGNLYAKRVGTGRERYSKSTSGWIKGHKIPVMYGDITGDSRFQSYMGLIPEDKSYYATNSKGEMVPVKEVGWDDADATPTHILVMCSSGCGTAYEGTPGMTLWVDNLGLQY
ncbi:MAG: PCMD domain-containing protein [Muribaculum sp.]|nr:PCMD domain-containing protein [Muribaculum sp.]